MIHKTRKRKVRFEVVPIAEAIRLTRTIEDELPADKQSGEKAIKRVKKEAKKTPRATGSR